MYILVYIQIVIHYNYSMKAVPPIDPTGHWISMDKLKKTIRLYVVSFCSPTTGFLTG